MGFNKRKMGPGAAKLRRRRPLSAARPLLEDADHLITVWNERRAKRMPMLFSPTIGTAITAGYWFLARAARPAGDLRRLDRHHGAAMTALSPALSCRSCRPNAPFAELVRPSKWGVAEE